MRTMALALMFFLHTTGLAQVNATSVQNLQLAVASVARLSISGDPQPLVLRGIPEGQNSGSLSDRSTSYRLISNHPTSKIVASIDRPMPRGTRLFVDLDSRLGNTQGNVDLSSAVSGVDVVTDIRPGAEGRGSITYTFVATRDAGTIFDASRNITFTLTN